METRPHRQLADAGPVPTAASDRPTALVTGSNGGIGLALAEKLAADGWRVLLHGRDAEKLARARDRLGGDSHASFRADLSRLGDVRDLAEAVREATDRLDVLVHNAGLVRRSFSRIAGIEATAAVNVLAPHVLTGALRPLLEATARDHGGARVVTVSSEAHRGASFPHADPDAFADWLRGPSDPARYSSIQAYARSKLAATTWAFALARRLEGTGVTSNACHPGVVRTGVFNGVAGVIGMLARLSAPLYLSPEAGAESPLLLATDPRYGRETGRWVTRGRFRGPHPADPPAATLDPANGSALWDALARLAD